MEAIKAAGDTPYVVGRIEDGEKGSDFMLKVGVLVSGVHESAGYPGCH